VLYEGSPLINDGLALFEIAEREKVTIFGTNPKFLRLLESNHKKPSNIYDLSKIRTLLSTGSPLLPDQYDFIGCAISPQAHISSISGGTDIVGCFALGCPDLPVVRGELQMRSLGLAVEVWSDSGEPIVGERGELVCTAPFPTVPLGFWNDPDRTRFNAAYFSRFSGVWHHGDYVELTPAGGMIFYGRSDAVLNPGGVRIGTAEIYREVERIPFVTDCIAVGQKWHGDERIILFVVLSTGEDLTDSRQEEIRFAIRTNASPFHVPRKIIAVPEIPHTRSGKLVELAVKQTIHGEPVKNRESLSNPEALDNFIGLPELLAE
jgi:acetoacetyl-CoA synthetase